MQKELINNSLSIFDKPEAWYAFIDLIEIKGHIQNVWIGRARTTYKQKFVSDDIWRVEFGDALDVRWHFQSESKVKINFWLSPDVVFNFVIPNDGKKAETIKYIFGQPKYDTLRYVWGTDVQTNFNHEIKLRQEGKWSFNSAYDGDFRFERLIWHVGNETESFVSQVDEKVKKFKDSGIVYLIQELQMEIEQKVFNDLSE